jgi:NIPSNAP
MLVDLRKYTFHPGKLQIFLERFQQIGLPLQTKYCGNLLGYFVSESGTLNQVVQLWAYKDAADRDERRAKLWADPEWQKFGEFALPLIAHQENQLLKATSFSPTRWSWT